MIDFPDAFIIDGEKARGLGHLIDALATAAATAGLGHAPVLSYDAAGRSTGYDRVLLAINLRDGLALRLSCRSWMLLADNHAKGAACIVSRWKEAAEKAGPLVEALRSARARVEAILAEAGADIGLRSLTIGDLDADDPISPRRLTFRAEIEHLDHLLVPRSYELEDAPLAEVVRKLREAGKVERRRAKQKTRLARASALFDVDILSGAAIGASGLSVAEIAPQLLATGIVQLPRFDGGHRLTVVLDEGVTRLVGEITAGPEDQLAVDDNVFSMHNPRSPEALHGLVGQSLRSLVNSPVTRAAGPIKRVVDVGSGLMTIEPRSISHRPLRIA